MHSRERELKGKSVFHFAQHLQVKAEEDGEQLWTDVDKSCRTLMETLHDASAQIIRDEVEEQRNGSVEGNI